MGSTQNESAIGGITFFVTPLLAHRTREKWGTRESKHASLGISLPGTFEEPKAPVYVDGRLFTTLKGDHIVAEFIKILHEYVESHYAARSQETVRV